MENEELQAAEAHIARLEEELLRLKDVKRDLQLLREEHQRLRRSAEGRVAKLLSAPFRILRYRKKPVRLDQDEYTRWFLNHRVSAGELGLLSQQSQKFSYRPLVSILTPTFNPDAEFLTAAVESVIAQIYENWELILSDDGSTDANTHPLLESVRQRDSRIRTTCQSHGGISAALNTALAMAKGEWIALLDHDDLLEPDALFRAVELLQNDRRADVIYSDEDKIVDRKFAAPMLKPDWSADFFLTHDYIAHFVVLRRDLAGLGFRSGFDGAQDYDLLLRVSEQTGRIRHIPRVLYHWRRTPQSTAHNIRRKPGALEAGRRAIQEHLKRAGQNGRVTIDWETHLYRVRYEVPPGKISFVINRAGDRTRLTTCHRHSDSERRLGTFRPSTDAKTVAREQPAFPKFEILTEAREASGEYVLFLDADLEPLDKNWLTAMAEQLSNPAIGAVGARILSDDNQVESAGLVLFSDGTVRFAFAGCARNFRGANRQLQAVRNYSAVSASCLLTRRDLLQSMVSGSATGLLNFAGDDRVCLGVKISLMLRDQGLRTVAVPYAELRRTSQNRNTSVPCPDLQKRWPEMFLRDPYYNPNLCRERADFSLGMIADR